jgi:4-carboxymuconolactone decarboxylase
MLAKWMSRIPGRETLKIFRTFAVHDDLAPRTGVLGAGLLSHPRVTPREREIVIHRMTALCGAEYEWGVHATLLGRPLGFTDEHIWALVRGDAAYPIWDERESLLIRLADEIHSTTNISAALWDELVKHWKNDQLLELVITAGWYRTVSLVVNVSGVELEEWAERFPSKGAHRTELTKGTVDGPENR